MLQPPWVSQNTEATNIAYSVEMHRVGITDVAKAGNGDFNNLILTQGVYAVCGHKCGVSLQDLEKYGRPG